MSDEKRQGWWIPPEIVELVSSGDISPSELVLLATIDYWVSADRGCYASNERLSKKTGINKTYISELISKLAEQGLVIRVAFNGRQRALETAWSRMDPNKVESPWLKGKLLKQRRIARIRDNRNQDSEIPKPEFEISESSVRNSRNRICKDKIKDKVEKQEHLSMFEPTGSNGTSSNGSMKSSSGKKKKPKPSAFDRRAADKLHKAVSKHIKVNCNSNMAAWSNDFRLLREVDGVPPDDIKAAIMWYAKNIGGEFIPDAFSAGAFRKKYTDGRIPAAMQRSQNGNGRRNGKASEEQDAVFDRLIEQARKGEL